MGISHRMRPWVHAISLLAALFPYLPAGGGRAAAAGFESIKFEVVDPVAPHGKGGSLEIKADGTCTYHGEGKPIYRHDTNTWPAKTYTHTLSDARMARLRTLLAATDWLKTPPGERMSFSSHDSTTAITLEAEGETRKAVCVGQVPDPYDGLLWFRTTLSRQERMLYELQCGDRSTRTHVCRDLGGPIPGLRGGPGHSPTYGLDYGRYVGEMRKILDEPEENRDGYGFMPMAAIAVLSQTGDEQYYEKIAGFVSDENLKVSRTAADALAHIRRPELIPYLVREMESGSATQYAAWALIRLGDIAVPAIAKVLAANDSQLAHQLVRTYIGKWDHLTAPLDPRILDALRIGSPKRGGFYAEYYDYVLGLARLRPITTDPVLGIAYRGSVVRKETSTLLHGWYICKDGKIVDHAAPPKTDTSVERLYPVHFRPEFVGGKVRFSAGWQTGEHRPWRAPVAWRAPATGVKTYEVHLKPESAGGTLRVSAGWQTEEHGPWLAPETEVRTYEVPVPENSVFEMDFHCGKRKVFPGGGGHIESGMRLTPLYRVLWQGRVVCEGKDVLTLAFIARLASPTDPVQEFVLPKEPLSYMPEPPRFYRSRRGE